MSTTDLATTNPHGSALVLQADQDRWTPQQLAALRQMGIENAPEGDLAVFMHVAQRTGLDPFAKQIHMIGRKTKSWNPETRQESWETRYTIQTGIDGYRVTAARAAKAAGDILEYGDTEWCGHDGQWVDVWVNSNQPPAAARVVVIKNGRRYAGTAMYAEYVQTYLDRQTKQLVPNSMWAKMPAGQLAKCAEALALRRAYPHDLAALYTDDEMGQADNPVVQGSVEPTGGLAAARARQHAEKIAAAQLDPASPIAVEMFRLMDELGIPSEARLEYVGDAVGREISSPSTVTVGDATKVIAALKDRLEQPFPDTVDGETVPDGVNPETGEVQG
jgi:phage recombination protein Bet